MYTKRKDGNLKPRWAKVAEDLCRISIAGRVLIKGLHSVPYLWAHI